ncbi:RHS repeat-associated core domain-containing protein [Pseudomonas shirazensis]
MKSQRIVSKLGDFDSYGADPRRVEKAGESFSGVKVDYDTKYKKSLQTVKANYASLDVPYYGLDNNDYVNGLGFCCNPSSTGGETAKSTAKMAKNDNAELQQFYYHPDHLGSSSYISNLDGEVVQHIEYVPFGEVFLEEKNSKWNTPYLFTSKELDRETGMYYMSARYQDPKLGIFISVDPLAEKFKGWSSYAYCYNNPVKFIDPTGMSPDNDYGIDKAGNVSMIKETKDNFDRLYKDGKLIGKTNKGALAQLNGKNIVTSDFNEIKFTNRANLNSFLNLTLKIQSVYDREVSALMVGQRSDNSDDLRTKTYDLLLVGLQYSGTNFDKNGILLGYFNKLPKLMNEIGFSSASTCLTLGAKSYDIAGFYHTHPAFGPKPSGTIDGGIPSLSGDKNIYKHNNLPGYIKTDDGWSTYGPDGHGKAQFENGGKIYEE